VPQPARIRDRRMDRRGSRKELGSLLLAYYAGRKLVYAAAPGQDNATGDDAGSPRASRTVCDRKMPLAELPPRDSRFGSPLELAHVHWVRPELVAEVTFLTWTDDGLLRQVVFQGLRQDKPARDVRLETP
jgi:ATP-dependent DNA ligase